MLRTINSIRKSRIHALDGDLGHLEDLYFDDEHWTIRYLVIDTGHSPLSREVLLSPFSVMTTVWEEKRLSVKLTRDQVRNAPDIDTKKPVSRLHEQQFSRYYGIPYYWGGAGIWGDASWPVLPLQPVFPEASEADRMELENSHLRSSNEVTGYSILARDGAIGHLEDLLFDDESWTLRYLIIDTKNWLPGKKVILSPGWITGIEWALSVLRINLSREQVKDAPAYDSTVPLSREYEERLHDHYGLNMQGD